MLSTSVTARTWDRILEVTASSPSGVSGRCWTAEEPLSQLASISLATCHSVTAFVTRKCVSPTYWITIPWPKYCNRQPVGYLCSTFDATPTPNSSSARCSGKLHFRFVCAPVLINTCRYPCSPVCLDRPIYPCRGLCERVRSGCEGRMKTYGYPWPDMLRCDKFPLDNDMCIGPLTTQSNSDGK